MNIQKNSKRGQHRVHASTATHKPVCGGGNSARSAQWQEVILEPNCQRCLAILNRKNSTYEI